MFSSAMLVSGSVLFSPTWTFFPRKFPVLFTRPFFWVGFSSSDEKMMKFAYEGHESNFFQVGD